MFDRLLLLPVGLDGANAGPAVGWLWLALVASGLYHGVNPGMGWPLAVSAGLMDKSPRALFRALWALSAGHLLATLLVLLPFAFLLVLAEWQRPVQLGASLLVIGFGVYRLIDRRHPRALTRIPPTQLALWSFAVAIAHGAALMLVPIYLGLCRAFDLDAGHEAAGALMKASLGMAVLVSLVHVTAMVGAGGCLAWLVYRHLGLRFVSRSWFNLDAVWATSLIMVGAVALAFNLVSWR
ncbi:membrane protein [Bradyrhizobium sp. CCBAU 51627]|nr:membrane protein [Bradyrhizobium sp. CCBAU 51627]